MLKITAIGVLFLNGLVVHFDGVLTGPVSTPSYGPHRGPRVHVKGRHYDPSYGYEPYWPGGSWVLSGDPDKPSTKPPPEVCGDECHYLYQEVGKVCGRDMDNIEFNGCKMGTFKWWCYGAVQDDYSPGYKTFDTYCEFMDEACKTAARTKPTFPRWIFVHRGPCIADHNTTYYKPMYLPEDPVSRLHFYLTSVADTFKDLGRDPF